MTGKEPEWRDIRAYSGCRKEVFCNHKSSKLETKNASGN
jgi:hypothetical protein